jgi:hypothetical protein
MIVGALSAKQRPPRGSSGPSLTPDAGAPAAPDF